MQCTGTYYDQETCQAEKMGCEGCYYNRNILKNKEDKLMLDEAIELMNKQTEMYKIMNKNLPKSYRKRGTIDVVKENLEKDIKVREYILKILQQKKEGILWKD